MRFAIVIAALLATGAAAAPEDDRASPESVVAASYQAISGPAGAKRDFARLEAISMPDMRFIMVTRGGAARVMSMAEFEAAFTQMMADRPFFESGIRQQTEGFGEVATVLSTYESRDAPGNAPFARGLNSYQLVKTGDGWRIQSLFWQDEAPDSPLPAKYLP